MASINVTVHKIDGLFTGGCQKGIDCSKVKSIGVKTISLPSEPNLNDCHETQNNSLSVQVEVIEYNGQTWYIDYNGTSIVKQCINNAFANNRTIQDFTFDCNTGDIAITFINGTNIIRNLKCLLPEIVDIVNIGGGNPNPLQKNTIQVKNTGEVFFVDKDGDIQQIEFLQKFVFANNTEPNKAGINIAQNLSGNEFYVGLDIENLPHNDINPKLSGGVPFYNKNTNSNEYIDIDRFMANTAIPKPEVKATNERQNALLVSYKQGGIEWQKYNPEIFLLRYKRHRKTTLTDIPNVEIKERRRNAWVHPTDSFMNSIGRWNGWKFFNGKHFDFKGNEIGVERRTEFPLFMVDINGNQVLGAIGGNVGGGYYTVHNQFVPYANAIIPFNVFGYSLDANNKWDVPFNVEKNHWRNSLDKFSGALKRQRNSSLLAVEVDGDQVITGNGRRMKKVHTQMYKVVFAIDNPFATMTNGLCPKIFGPESDIIFVRNYLERSEQIGRYIRVGPTNSIP